MLAPLRVIGGRVPERTPWRSRHRGLYLAFLLLMGCVVAGGVLLTARGDGVRPAAGPATLAVPHVAPDALTLTWTPAARATGYIVRISRDPQMSDVVWSGPARGAQVELSGGAIHEGRTLYAAVTSTWHGLPGATSPVVRVQTPLAPPVAPTQVAVRGDTTGLTVTWPDVPTATSYRVIVMQGTGKHAVLSTSTRFASTRYRAKVRDGASYLVVVQAYRGALQGPKSQATRASTPLKRLGGIGAPTVRALSTSSIKVAWKPVTNATGYAVTLAATPTSKQRTVLTTSKTSATIDGLNPSSLHLHRIFYVRVVANRWGQTQRSSHQRAATVLAGTAHGSVAFTTTVATYNMLGVQYEDDADRSWARRFTLAGKQLRGVQIAGLQEVAWAKDGSKRPVSVVAKAAHLTIAKHPHSSSPCTTQAQPILYDAHKFKVLGCGFTQLSKDGPHPFATWVQFQQKASKKKFLVVNTHLVAYSGTHASTTTAMQKLRVKQSKALVKVVAKHRKHGEPVIMTGDYNSYPGRWTSTPLDVLAAKGFTSAVLTARGEDDGDYNSYHGFDGAKESGHPIDHVLTSAQVVARSYRVHVTKSAKAPSDHYEISTVLQVHR